MNSLQITFITLRDTRVSNGKLRPGLGEYRCLGIGQNRFKKWSLEGQWGSPEAQLGVTRGSARGHARVTRGSVKGTRGSAEGQPRVTRGSLPYNIKS